MLLSLTAYADETAAAQPAWEVTEGVTYDQVGDRKLLCDIYTPTAKGPHPGMLVVHGGAWRSGSRRQLRGYCTALAERGFVCYAIDYRLAPKHKFPAQIDDCRSALKWIRKTADSHKLDPARIGAIGYSAGGHLVSLLATTGEPPSADNGNIDTRLSAVVAGGAPTDFRWFPDNGRWAEYWMGGDLSKVPEKFQQASAVPFVDKNDCPIFFFNGTKDQLVPILWTRPLHDALKQNGIDTQMHLVKDAGHMQAAADKEALTKGYEFLAARLKPTATLQDTPSTPPKLKLKINDTEPQASYRAIGVGKDGTVLVGGSGSRVFRTTDSGATWQKLNVTDDELDFRDVEQATDGSWLLMSAGNGPASQLFRSTDNGDTWQNVYANTLPKAFFNGLDFWANGHGLLIGDPLDGRLFLLSTKDHGATWTRIEGPAMRDGEYGFAASGTGIVTAKDGIAWVATGAAASRVLTTTDYGVTWQAADTGLRHGSEGAGIFSLAASGQTAIVVGGNYLDPAQSENNCAISRDGGTSWQLIDCTMPHKACVRFLSKQSILAIGRTGIMHSPNAGQSWNTLSEESFYTFDVTPDGQTAFLAGADGRVATLTLNP